ncbi:sigma-54-dependent transcriptional regulator [candidate division KSB1 bacterium]
MEKLKVLIADDEKKIRLLLTEHLSENYDVYSAVDGLEARDILLEKDIDVILLDIKMPGMDGMKLLKQIYSHRLRTIVIMISGHGTIQDAIESIRLGAFEYIEKPFKAEQIIDSIERAISNKRLREQGSDSEFLDSIIGESQSIRELKEKIRWIAPSEGRILITGENGTGKDLAAQAIHSLSMRGKGPFIPVHCGAIPSELFESELFGYKKGAFTGAYSDKEGKYAAADGGTLFLDEIGELPLQTQVKLLRILETSKVQMIGSLAEKEVNVRVICATNKDLKEETERGKFRKDLYYRFNVIEIHLSPLRDRIEDIPMLANRFFREYSAQNKSAEKAFSPDALAYLIQYDWPGNVRELKNLVERMVLQPTGSVITKAELLKHWNPEVQGSSGQKEKEAKLHKTFHEAKKDFEKTYILQALQQHDGKVPDTAEYLGLDKSWLYRKMKELRINPDQLS